jgi:hypothetical protein
MVVLIYRSLTELLGIDQAFSAMLNDMDATGYGKLDGVFSYTRWTDTACYASATVD